MKTINYALMLGMVAMALSCQSSAKKQKEEVAGPLMEISVKRDSAGAYLLTQSKAGNGKVYGMPFNSREFNSPVIWTADTLRIACSPSERLIFAVADAKDTAYYSERHLSMQGTPNFRDLGGYRNKDGKQIKWGAIYRSGELSHLTPRDLALFASTGIKKVIDFRTDMEVARNPDKYPGNAGVVRISSPIGSQEAMGHMMGEFSKPKNLTAEKARELMVGGGKNFAASAKDFQPVVDALVNGGPQIPFLFHCSAGKDRAGFSAALVLGILKVDRNTIMEDYLLSNKYTLPYYRKNGRKPGNFSGVSADALKPLMGVEPEYMQASWEAIDNTYGSIDNMLQEVFGITPETRQQIIDKYTY